MGELSATGANLSMPGFTSRSGYKHYLAHAGADPENTPRWDESELILADGEKVITCPECGDAHCYSGPAYDECDQCGYVAAHGAAECPCCSAMTLERRNYYEICPLCGWEDDGDDPDYSGGPNGLSLNQYRAEWEARNGKVT